VVNQQKIKCGEPSRALRGKEKPMRKYSSVFIIVLLILSIFIPLAAQAKPRMYTEADIDKITLVVMGEAENQSFLGRAAVALTVINRYESGKYGNSLNYITRRSQYCKASQKVLKSNKPKVKQSVEKCRAAVIWALVHRVLPSNTYYFQRSKRSTWGGRPSIKRYTRIMAHTFYTLGQAKEVAGDMYIDRNGKLIYR
jgi:spore germination cell wall hydrolase CwlJ-like protein